MSPRETSRPRIGRARWAAALLVSTALLLPYTSSLAEPPGISEPVPGVFIPPCEGGATIAIALCTASQAYSRGDIPTARSWTALASKLLAAAPAPEAGAVPYPASNASQLLELLQLYGTFVYGTRPELDAQYTMLVPQLQQIEALNRDAAKPDHLGPEPVEYHLITHLVTRIGDLQIEYHLLTRQITRLGDVRLDYNTLTRMPEKIGGIELGYDTIDGGIRTIAGADVR
jgi:hypothetical protein